MAPILNMTNTPSGGKEVNSEEGEMKILSCLLEVEAQIFLLPKVFCVRTKAP